MKGCVITSASSHLHSSSLHYPCTACYVWHTDSLSLTNHTYAKSHTRRSHSCTDESCCPQLTPACVLMPTACAPLQFLCHLQVSLLEPSKAADAKAAAAQPTGHKAEVGADHHTEHAMSASGASKLRSLLKGHQEPDSAPPLTSRYIRVVNTFDVSCTLVRAHLCFMML